MESLYLINHKIKDFGGFAGEHSVNLNPTEPSVILGVNGTGKTSLLKSFYASCMMLVFNERGNNWGFLGLTVPNVNNDSQDLTVESLFQYISNFKSNRVNTGVTIDDSGNPKFLHDRSNTDKLFREISKDKHNPMPVLRLFTAEKNVDNRKLVVTQTTIDLSRRNQGYHEADANHFVTDLITQFFMQQINIENQEKVDKGDLGHETKIGKYLRTTLKTFVEELYEGEIEIKTGASKYSKGQSLMLTVDDKQLEYIQLSSGEKYVISMVLEIAYRNVVLNSDISDLNIASGIIMIDEIESHLHPRWQLNIIDALTTTFPKMQFIVSTHSPLVASTVYKDQLVVLDDFQIIDNDTIPNLYSGSADELLKNILHADNRLDDYEEEQNQINILINEKKFGEADEKLKALKDKVKASPKWLTNIERKLNFVKA